MSLPNEIDWALIKMGDGANTENFTVICGLADVTINESANTSDRFVRDCAEPGAVPFRFTRVSGRQLDVSGSGLSNADEVTRLSGATGKVKNYKIELYKDDGTDGGDLLGTYTGAFRMTANNLNLTRDGDSAGDISLASQGEWTYAAAA